VADFRRYGEQVAVVTYRGNRRFSTTYAELAELSGRCAAAFEQRGIQAGDRILLWGNNSAEWMAAFFGCILRGIVAVPLDAAGTTVFARRVTDEVRPALLVGDRVLLQQLDPGISRLGFDEFSTLPAAAEAPWDGLSRASRLQIIFTSGTTGDPKGIVHTHGNVLASLDPLEKEMAKYQRYVRWVHPLRILHTLPLSHVFGQFMGLWVPPLLTAEVHFEDRLQAPRLAKLLKQERLSVLAAVPRVLDLLRVWLEGEFPGLRDEVAAARGLSISKRWWRFRAVHRRLGWKFWAFVSGGATLPADLETFWTTIGFALVQGYGMTETTALVTLNHPFKIARGSIGKPLAGREVQISPEGEILVRGASISSEVWQQGRLQERDAGWLATGDLATRNAAGELVFAGRKSDVIVTAAGLNIHPEDLEAVLRRQEGVRECLIVAFDAPNGPAPVAVIIGNGAGNGDADLQGAVDRANQDLAAFQQIRYWLRWPQPEFPRTSTGKVLRRPVQNWAQQSLAGGEAGVADPADRLVEVLRGLGVTKPTMEPGDRLSEDLHLDSLAMVQLQSALEARFGVELEEAEWAQVSTVGQLRALLMPAAPGAGGVAVPSGSTTESTMARKATAGSEVVLPRWPWSPAVRWLRIAFLEAVARPAIGLVLAPKIAPRRALARPSLLVANHLTAFDVPVILYALSRVDRDHVAVAMSGRLLTGWKQGKAERHAAVAWLTPVAYWLVTAMFNVFPLPRGAGLRRSFAHAGEAMDNGYHVLVFPEGGRSADGGLKAFEPGIGILAQESNVAVQPIRIEGLKPGGGRRWPGWGKVSVRLGTPLTLEAGEDPADFARRLERAVAEL
jgi:long-chain acyl-CoA synthetase